MTILLVPKPPSMPNWRLYIDKLDVLVPFQAGVGYLPLPQGEGDVARAASKVRCYYQQKQLFLD